MTVRQCIALYGGRLMHGGGYTFEQMNMGFAKDPDYMATDGGSTDAGPYYLGTGEVMGSRSGLKQSIKTMIAGVTKKKIPLLLGSVGMAGGRSQVSYYKELVEEVAREEGLHFRLATIQTEMDKDYLCSQVDAGKIRSFDGSDPLTKECIGRSAHVVAMMGPEPMIAALKGDADVVVCGRCSDSALFASYPLMHGFPPALCWHMAKTIECNALILDVPKGSHSDVYARLTCDGFIVAPTSDTARCPRVKVAAHTLYENASPNEFHEPGGTIDTSGAIYEQYDERSVRVSGSRWLPAPKYTVKLEGAELLGYRTIFIGGVRDPILIRSVDAFLDSLKQIVNSSARSQGIASEDFDLKFLVYGRNAVMGELERATTVPYEIGILCDCVARTQYIANAVMNIAHGKALHYDYPGRIAIAGNMAYPFSPSDIPAGPVYQFNVWHLMEVDDPTGLFPIEFTDF